MCMLEEVAAMERKSSSGERRTCMLALKSLDRDWVVAIMGYLLYSEKLAK